MAFTSLEADDVAQEAFLSIFTMLRRGGGPDRSFRAYAIRAAKNAAVNMARGSKGEFVKSLDESCYEATALDARSVEDEVLDRLLVEAALLGLPEPWRTALWLREVEALQVKEIAVRFGKSENATSALLKRARVGLSNALQGPASSLLERGVLRDEQCVGRMPRAPRRGQKPSCAFGLRPA